MMRLLLRALPLLIGFTITQPALAATWETVSQESQDFWVPDVVSTRSILVSEPVYDWVAEEPWHPVIVLAATAAVTIQRIPASQVQAVFGGGQKATSSSGRIGAFQGQRTSGNVNLSGLKSREVLGADRSRPSSSRAAGQQGQSTLRNGNAVEPNR